MDALAYILTKYQLDPNEKLPIEIPNTGRDTLAALFAELGYTAGAEIGTERGLYAEMLCKANPGLCLHCIDLWQTYDGYRDHLDAQKLNRYGVEAVERLKPYHVEFIREYSMQAVQRFQEGSLDFVYIDANHEWPYITQDIYYWSKKVCSGGIVAGHDYYRSNRLDSKCHVKPVVNAFTYTFRIAPWFILGLDAKIPGMVRDISRSWFWVKG